MKIQEEIVFAQATRQEAITLANDMVGGGIVQEVHIGMAVEPVCWIVRSLLEEKK